MRILEKKLNDMGFRNQMMIIYYVCILLPIVSLSVFFCLFLVQQTQQQFDSDVRSSLNSANYEIESYFSSGIMIADSLYTNRSVIYKSLSDRPGRLLINRYDNTTAIDAYIDSLKVISNCQSISIYTDSDNINEGMHIKKISQYVKEEDWYAICTQAPEKIKFFYYKNASGIELLSYYRILDYEKLSGYSFIKIDFELSKLTQILNRYQIFEQVYLLDDSNAVVYSRPYVEGSAVDLISNTCFVELIYPPNWRLVTSTTTSEFMTDLLHKLSFYILIFLALIILSSLLIFYFSHTYKKRIDLLTWVVKQSENQVFQRIDEKSISKDELGVLANGINQAFEKINHLINEVYEEKIRNVEIELESKDNELRALYNQINPHFLFNIMATLCMKSLMKGEKETATVLKNLSKFYRDSLSWFELLIPIEKELNFVKEYLSIQKYRFNDTLDYTIYLDPAAKSYNIPKMAILIFVENSCVHGFAGKKGPKTLSIDVHSTNDGIEIIITDNGCGIKEDTLAKINNYAQLNADNHLGIYNVKQRFSFYYKDRNKITLENVTAGGTKVTVEIRGESCNVQSINRRR